MELNHLHLHVRDVGVSRSFYETHLRLTEKVRYGDLLFLRDESGFDLALMLDESPAAMPPWFHFGCRLASASAVRATYESMRQAGVTIRKALYEDPELVSFTCEDPDGYAIEIYWE